MGQEKQKVIAGDMKELDGKPRMDLIPECVLESVASAFAYGGKYYEYWNWRLGNTGLARYYGAARRHMIRWYEHRGIGGRMDTDPVSHVQHIDAAIASLLILRDLEMGMCDGSIPNVVDDRPKNMVELLRRKRLKEAQGEVT